MFLFDQFDFVPEADSSHYGMILSTEPTETYIDKE